MKIQYIGDGTSSMQVFTCPRMTLRKWQSFTATKLPEFVATAPAGTFLIDGKPNPKPVPKPKPEAKLAAKPEPKPAKPGKKE